MGAQKNSFLLFPEASRKKLKCARLLINAIIFYKGSLLSALLKKYNNIADQKTLDIIKRISSLAWTHINVVGRMEFLVDKPNIDVDQIIADINLF